MSGTWQNGDGLYVRFAESFRGGGQQAPYASARVVRVDAKTHQLVLDFDLDGATNNQTFYTSDLDNDGTPDGFNSGDVYIPAGAVVKDAKLYVGETGAGGTAVTVGGYQLDGTAVDATGFFTATEGAVANIVKGDVLTGAGGDFIDNTDQFTAPTYVTVTTTGVWTAGKGTIVIEYVVPNL